MADRNPDLSQHSQPIRGQLPQNTRTLCHARLGHETNPGPEFYITRAFHCQVGAWRPCSWQNEVEV